MIKAVVLHAVVETAVLHAADSLKENNLFYIEKK